MYGMVNVLEFLYSTSMTSVSRIGDGALIKKGALSRMGVLIGIGALINKNTFLNQSE